MSRGWAAAAYVPVPLWPVVCVLSAPASRLVRHHAWQAGTWTVAWILLLAAMAPLAGTGPAGGFVAGIATLVAIGGLLWGATAALRGRFSRLRPAWDLVTYAKGSPTRAS